MKKWLLSLFVVGLCSLPGLAEQAGFMTDPAPSPDGQTLVFCFEGDLWQLNRSTHEAFRLTAMQGYERDPVFSPDGRWLAFSGTQYGNPDVFVISAAGGPVKQITFHDAADQVEGWTWDSQHILFRSNRENAATVYRVPVEGGHPERLFSHYFNVVHHVAVHPVSGELFFNDTWESLRMASRKRYQGQYDPDIQSWHPETKKHQVYTEWDGKDMWVSIDRQGQVYFVSDQHTGQYNLFRLEQGQPLQLTSYPTSIYHPQVSADGSVVVFEKDYQLWVYDVATEKARQEPVRIIRNSLLPAEQSFPVAGKITAFDVSADQKKLAFVSRGALFVSDIKGKFVKEIAVSDPFERVQEVYWLKDNQSLIFSMTWKGYSNWFTVAADGSGKVRQLTKDLRNNRSLEMDPTQEVAAYLSGRDELRIMDLNGFETTATIQDEFWGMQSGELQFSPDSKWLLYTAKRDFESDVFAYELKTQKSINLTGTGISENSPTWDPDGQSIYLVSNRLKPSYPTGGGDNHIYRVALDQYDKEFRSEKFADLFDPDTTRKEPAPIRINPEKIWERYERIGPSFGSQTLYRVMKSGNKTTILFGSNHKEGSWELWKLEKEAFEKDKTVSVTGISGRAGVLIRKDKVYALAGGSVYEVNMSSNKAEKMDIQATLSRAPGDEFRQMFAQTWSNIEENFYDDDLHNEDWDAHRTYYEQFLPLLNNREDFRRMMNDMLGELNSSHMGFTSGGPEEKGLLSYSTAECGIVYETDDPLVVSRVMERGPAAREGIDIRRGDRLIEVDGTPVSDKWPRDYYFYQPARKQEMELVFDRGGERISVWIHPESSRALPGWYYEEWIDQNAERVREWSDNSIAYAHMKNMGGGELNAFIMTMTRELPGKKGLILDLRYNTGGNVHDDVLRFLQQRTYLQWKARGGQLANQSNFAPSDYPIVLLINEQSLSDAEMTAAGFKELGLGTLIGTETYRWIIFTSGMGLVDGSFHRMPGWGCYTLDGVNLEKSGVQPDIFIRQSFTDRLQDQDPQLRKAVDVMLK